MYTQEDKENKKTKSINIRISKADRRKLQCIINHLNGDRSWDYYKVSHAIWFPVMEYIEKHKLKPDEIKLDTEK